MPLTYIIIIEASWLPGFLAVASQKECCWKPAKNLDAGDVWRRHVGAGDGIGPIREGDRRDCGGRLWLCMSAGVGQRSASSPSLFWEDVLWDFEEIVDLLRVMYRAHVINPSARREDNA